MNEFSKISRDFWINPLGKKIRNCEPEVKLLRFYLMTCTHANMIGIYYLPLPLVAHEMGVPLEGVQRGLEALIKIGFCSYDLEAEYVWIHEMAISQIGILKKNDNRVKYVNCLVQKLPEINFLPDFYKKYRDFLQLALPKTKDLQEGASKGLQRPFEAIQNREYRIQNRDIKKDIPIIVGGEQAPSSIDEEKLPVKNVIAFPVKTQSSVVFTIPLREGGSRVIEESEIDEWQKNYPEVNVRQEIRKLIAWNEANPGRQKTKRGINRHIYGWLAHAKKPNNPSVQSLSTWDHNMAVIEQLLEEENGRS